MARLLTLLVLVLFAGSACACLNDGELESHEREFRSHYGTTNHPAPNEVRPPESFPSKSQLLTGSGAILFLGAVVLVTRQSRSKE